MTPAGASRREAGPKRALHGALAAGLLVLLLASPNAWAQERRPLIDVEFYDIAAKIDLSTQTLKAEAQVRFIPREETNALVFDLNNGLNVNRVATPDGSEVYPVRYQQDFTVRLTLPKTLPVGEPTTLTFDYEGQLEGDETSPVEGVSLAAIDTDRAYLLYPGRWFPVNGYGADRFAARIRVTVPEGLKVISSGLSTRTPVTGGVEHTFEFNQASFPGSIAVVPEGSTRVENQGIATEVYFHTASPEMAQAYGEAVGEMLPFFTEKFGAPYSSSLTLVELGERSPDGYAAPGIIFLNPYSIGQSLNRRLLGAQVAHQWWPMLVSPGNRNHEWLDLGLAMYSALLEVEHSQGEGPFGEAVQDVRIESLTYEDIPLIQSSRLPEFSAELRALAGAKGAMVLHMLRWVIGDEPFFKTLRQFRDRFEWRSVTTADLREVAEAASGKNLQPFFIQWTESTGTPEFSQEYTIYRLGQGKGFRVLGKVKQDMDTFSMPVELKIETEGEPEFQTIEVKGTSSDYTIDTFGKPKSVVLDPNNRILRFDDRIRVRVAIRKGENLVELGYYNEALTEYQKALDIRRYSSLAHYRIAEVFFLQNNYQSAANEFRESLNGDQEPAWTQVWSHINLGKIFDITGQRERAVNEYQLAIRTSDNTQGAQDEARKYLESPYVRPRRAERIY